MTKSHEVSGLCGSQCPSYLPKHFTHHCRALYGDANKIICVHIYIFFRKIIEIGRFVLRAAILHECQNYLGGGGGLNVNASCSDVITVPLFFSPLPLPPTPRAIIPTSAPLVHLKIKIPVTVRRDISKSKRSHEKIDDCEQSIVYTVLVHKYIWPPEINENIWSSFSIEALSFHSRADLRRHKHIV